MYLVSICEDFWGKKVNLHGFLIFVSIIITFHSYSYFHNTSQVGYWLDRADVESDTLNVDTR